MEVNELESQLEKDLIRTKAIVHDLIYILKVSGILPPKEADKLASRLYEELPKGKYYQKRNEKTKHRT